MLQSRNRVHGTKVPRNPLPRTTRRRGLHGKPPDSPNLNPIRPHHLPPGPHKIPYEPPIGVRACINIRERVELEPKTRSTRVAVHWRSPVALSRPSRRSSLPGGALQVVSMSGRLTNVSAPTTTVVCRPVCRTAAGISGCPARPTYFLSLHNPGAFR